MLSLYTINAKYYIKLHFEYIVPSKFCHYSRYKMIGKGNENNDLQTIYAQEDV